MARRNSYKGKYALGKYQFLHAKYHALRYGEWKEELGREHDPARREELLEKTGAVEEAAMEAAPGIYGHLLRAVTEEGVTYNLLRMSGGIPCGPRQYYEARRRFYWILSRRI